MSAPRLVVSRSLIPSHSVVTSPEEKLRYASLMCEAWGAPFEKVNTSRKRSAGGKRRQTPTSTHGKPLGEFPACNPVGIRREHVPLLSRDEYVVALKSDGVRYALFLFLRSEGTGVALMIDRSWNMYEVDVLAPEEYFERGTLLEGELVLENSEKEERMVFLVFDCVLSRGERFGERPFLERLEEARRLTHTSEDISALPQKDMEEEVLASDAIVLIHFDPRLVIRPKQFVDRIHAKRMWSFRHDATHRVDGVILNKASAPYNHGTARGGSVLKWKEHTTVDFELRNGLLCTREAPLPDTLLGRRVIVHTSDVSPSVDGEICEFSIKIKDDKVQFFPVRRRKDKGFANGDKVLHAAVHDTLDPVRCDDI